MNKGAALVATPLLQMVSLGNESSSIPDAKGNKPKACLPFH